MTSSDIRLIISRLKEMNRINGMKLEEGLARRAFFGKRVVEVGEDYLIGYKVTIKELLEEQKRLIEIYEKEIAENNNLITKLEEELEEV